MSEDIGAQYKAALIAMLHYEMGKTATRISTLAEEAPTIAPEDVTAQLAAIDAYTRIGEAIAKEITKVEKIDLSRLER